MPRFRYLTALVAGLVCGVGLPVANAEPLEFNRDIRPILSDKCFACHGFDAKKREAELRLDTAEGAQADHDGKRAIVPGDLTASEAWRRITSTNDDERMPPPTSHKELSPAEREVIKRWIEEGAKYQKHWAFEPPVMKEPAATDGKLSNPIDRFIAARLAKEGWSLSPEADRSTLIRRVAFATTGLPPTPAEVDAYLQDQSPDAYEKMVDRYLASRHYGEEMARHWLDVARYADTHGLHLDNERQMWGYRDWVISAFNKNQPFHEFTIEQLAGDLLPNPTLDQLIATGFNRCNVTTSEGGSIAAEYQFRYAVDRTSTVMQTWLGLTGGCAVCHDHKFDPISQKEFYSFYAFFNSAADPAMDGNALLTQPVQRMETPEQKQRIAELGEQIAAKQRELEDQAARVTYIDPATLNPAPEVAEHETIWFDDEFPAGAEVRNGPGGPTQFVEASEVDFVYSGKRSLKRTDNGLAQDFYEGGAQPLEVPHQAKIVAYVYLSEKHAPRSIMLQFNKGGWKHRAVWGDYEAIDWGAKSTMERVNMGPLPKLGEWVRLEFPADKVGLNTGDKVSGFAFTQFGGTVYWDHLAIVARTDPATDPQLSFQAWWTKNKDAKVEGLDGGLAGILKQGIDKAKPDDAKRLLNYYVQAVCSSTKPQFAAVRDELTNLKKTREGLEQQIPSSFIYRDTPSPRDSFVMQRGAYDKPGDKVLPDVPEIFPRLKLTDLNARPTRLDLARWLVSPDHPLTARVTVNRFWQQFFGRGLVKTSYDFGSQGEMPSHPELLDWLALHFQQEHWNVKGLVRLLLTSSTFKQSAKVTPAMLAKDPENRLYARGPRFRLDAEQIRDNALFVSGLIDLQMGGKGVKPYQPGNIWEPVGFVGSNTRFYKQDTGSALYRRSIYTFFKRTAPPPFMTNFDAPNREQFCTVRERSDTPLQALQLMNDVQHVEAARALAERLMKQGGEGFESRLALAYKTLLSRDPRPREVEVVRAQFEKHLQHYRTDEPAAKQLIALGATPPAADLPAVELASYTMVCNMLLNLDETLNRN